jgi:capsule polysaccharide export protein KpsE/RkpR
LAGIAGIAGINVGTSPFESFSPQIYPEIVKSIPFQLKLIHAPVYFQKIDSTISSYVYFNEIQKPSLVALFKKYTIGLPGLIKGSFSIEKEVKNQNSFGVNLFTKKEWSLLQNYKERLNVIVDANSGIISVSTKMPDPFAAAMITDLLVKQLAEEVTRYKIEKVKINLDFVKERYDETEQRYQQKQQELALFADKNKNINSSIAKIEIQRLQYEVNIAFEVFKGLARQLEQARIKVKEEMPVFTVLEPTRVPEDTGRSRKSIIVIVFIFLGFISGVYMVLIKAVMLSGDLPKKLNVYDAKGK